MQKAIIPGNYENEKLKQRDIQQAIDPAVADAAEMAIKGSGQDLTSENLAPDGKHYPFCILKPNKEAELVVMEWFKVKS